MPIFEWDEELATGNDLIDRQHRHLVGLVNRAYDSASDGAAGEEWANIIRELVEYATYHFYFEECWMKEVGYPDLAEHKEEHDRLVAKVVGLKEESAKGEATPRECLVSLLLEWFVTHIMASDGRCGQFAKAKTAAATPANRQPATPKSRVATVAGRKPEGEIPAMDDERLKLAL